MMKNLTILLVISSLAATVSAQTTVFSDNMTSFPTGWTLSPTTGWVKSSTRYYSASYSARCDDVSPYGNSQNNYMTRTVSLAGYASASLSFYVWQYTESGYDYVYVQYYSGSTWTTAWSRAGNYQSWSKQTVTIPTTATQVRFWFKSDGSLTYTGAYVDDVVLTATGAAIAQNDAGTGGDAGNTIATATLVNPGSWTGCYLDATDRNDYYKFNVTSGQVIKVKITPPSAADFDLYLHNPSQTQVGSSTRGAGLVDSIVYTANATGYWYCRAYQYSGTGNYGLSISTASPNPFKYICLKVGQGDAAVLVSPTGKYALIDGGSNNTYGLLIWKFLRDSLRTHHLDYIFTSHYHSDHVGGTDLIIDSLCAHGMDSIVVGCYDRGGSYGSGTDYTNYVTKTGSKRRTASLGQVFDLGGGLSVRVVCMNGKTVSGDSVVPASSDENGKSMGLLISYGGFKLISAGDIAGYNTGDYKNVESILAPDIGPVNVLHVNHHSSASSSNPAWISTLDPQASLISLGDGNPYGYPKAETLTRLTSDPGLDNYIYQTETGAGAAIPAGRGQVCNSNIWVVVNQASYTVCGRPYGIAKGGDPLAPNPGPEKDGDGCDSWASVSPNPVSGSRATISFSLPAPGKARAEVYNVLGQRVRTMEREGLPAGRHQLAWDCADDRGRRLASGTYLLRFSVTADGRDLVSTRRIMLLR